MVLCQVALLALTLANSALATHSPHWAECVGNADEKIKAACTAIIEQKGRSPQELARALVWRGVWYRNHGQFHEAYADFDRAVNLDPRHFPGLIGRGLMLQAQFRLVAAYADFSQAITIAPKDSYSYVLRGDVLVRMGQTNRSIADYDRAIDDYDQVLILEPNHPSAQRMKEVAQKGRTELFARGGDPAELAKWLAQKFPGYSVGTMQRPDQLPKPPPAASSSTTSNQNVFWPPGFPEQGTPATPGASSIVRKYDDTVAFASKAITAAIDPAAALSGRLVLQGQFESALEHFERVLADVPDHNDALVGRGFTYLILGRFDEASDNFDRALDANPDNGRALVGQGLLSLSGGQLDSALGNFSDAIGIDPKDEYGYALRGDTRVRKGQWTEASADFDRAIALKPDSADLLVIRGMALGRNGFRELAIVDFNRAIELDGNFVEAYIGRGNTFAARQDFGRALADYDRALSLAPGQQQARTLKAIATKNQAALGSSDPKGIRTITIRPEPGLKYERGKTNSGESAATPP